MAFKLWTKTKDDAVIRSRPAGTAPLPQLPQSRHVPSTDEVRQHWAESNTDGTIPAVLNLFGDATGTLLRGRMANAQNLDDFLGIVSEARAYGDHEIAHLALDRARSLAIRDREIAQLDALQAALKPSELEQALNGNG